MCPQAINDWLAVMPMAAVLVDAKGTVLGINTAASAQLGGVQPGVMLPQGTETTSAQVNLNYGTGQVRLIVLDASAADWRMQEIGRLKHEICNSIMGVMGYAELVGDVPDLPMVASEAMKKILTEMRRVKEQLHELGRLQQVG